MHVSNNIHLIMNTHNELFPSVELSQGEVVHISSQPCFWSLSSARSVCDWTWPATDMSVLEIVLFDLGDFNTDILTECIYFVRLHGFEPATIITCTAAIEPTARS